MVDRDLETICLKCLEKDPGRRYPSGEALADDLARWRNHEPIAARPVGPAGRVWRWCRRKPRTAMVLATAALLAVATVAGLVATVRAQAEALAQKRRADDRFDRVIHGVGARAIDMLRGLVDLRSASVDVRVDSGGALVHVAEIEFLRGETEAGFRDLEAMVVACDRLEADFPGNRTVFHMIGQAHHILALRMAAEGRAAAGIAEHCASAAAAYRRALEFDPVGLGSLSYSSWFLAIAPAPRFRDPDRAIALASRALDLYPGTASVEVWNNLGVALYRAGRFGEAIAALETSTRLRNQDDALESFFLAMAHARLDHPNEARKLFDEASLWMDRHNPTGHELILFRAEARETLSRSVTTHPTESSENRPPRAR
jgi:hypothetical protein